MNPMFLKIIKVNTNSCPLLSVFWWW